MAIAQKQSNQTDSVDVVSNNDQLISTDFNSSVSSSNCANTRLVAPITSVQDSISFNDVAFTTICANNPLTQYKSLVENQTVYYPSARLSQNEDWSTWVVLIILLIVSILKANDPKRFNQMFSDYSTLRFANTILKDRTNLIAGPSMAIVITILLILGLFYTQICQYLALSYSLQTLIKCMGLLFLFYTVKFILIRISEYVFKSRAIFSLYSSDLFLSNKILAAVLIPVIISVAFFHTIPSYIFIYLGLGLNAMILGIRLMRCFVTGTTVLNLSIFYIILYLCTLEILPVLVILKYLSDLT